MMEAARTSETVANFYQTTRRYNPEDSHLKQISLYCGRALDRDQWRALVNIVITLLFSSFASVSIAEITPPRIRNV
jgi:hypothetical protein